MLNVVMLMTGAQGLFVIIAVDLGWQLSMNVLLVRRI